MVGNVSKKLRYLKKFLAHPQAPDTVRADLFRKATDPSQARHKWVDGAPISQARNAHYTNTAEELTEGLSKDYNFLEGDVWLEGAARQLPGLDLFREPIMAHDYPDVDGLTLREWLEAGKASGKGIKLDVKGSAVIPKVIETIQDVGLPQERLVLNADMVHGPGWKNDTKFKIANVIMDIQTSVEEMREFREAFPRATLAVGLYTAAAPEGTRYTPEQIAEVSTIADKLGGPITFPLRAEFVSPDIVAELKPHGTVSIWNDPSTFAPSDLEAARQHFRDMGVDGMIDLRAD